MTARLRADVAARQMEIAMISRLVSVTAGLIGLIGMSSVFAADVNLLNVSYDPTRELYVDFNKAFASAYQKETGKSIEIKQSHGGSSGRCRDHAQPENIGRRALELPRRLGLRAEEVRLGGEGQGVCGRSLSERAGARYRRTRLDGDVRRTRRRRCADRLGE